MRKSVTSRIRKTKTGKLIRRKIGQSHFRAKKSGKQIREKRSRVNVTKVTEKMIANYI
jgi:ribosomal protein L35